MKRKTPGQIAFDTYYAKWPAENRPHWDASPYSGEWEVAAAAVLADQWRPVSEPPEVQSDRAILCGGGNYNFREFYSRSLDHRLWMPIPPLPQPVDEFADLKAAHAAGKLIQRKHTVDPDKWVDLTAERFQKILQEGYPIKFLRVKPWTLSRHLPGFRPLEDGEEWLHSNFTEELMPQGFRPILKGESQFPEDDEIFEDGEITHSSKILTDQTMLHNRVRTTRPLPPTKAELETKAFETWWNEYKLGCVDITPNRRTAYAAWQAARNQ